MFLTSLQIRLQVPKFYPIAPEAQSSTILYKFFFSYTTIEVGITACGVSRRSWMSVPFSACKFLCSLFNKSLYISSKIAQVFTRHFTFSISSHGFRD
jgi:hypothetical protein